METLESRILRVAGALLRSVWLQDWMERIGRFPWNQKAKRVAMHTVRAGPDIFEAPGEVTK